MRPKTKFLVPFVGNNILARPELIKRLQLAVANHPLTLISAPAGSGKTTLLAQWQLQAVGYQVAWLRLDEYDNALIPFLLGVVDSIRQIFPTFTTNLDSLVTSIPKSQQRVHQLLSLLINDILQSAPERLVLVIEDLHKINEAAILEAFQYFLEHLPLQMALIITSRYEPPLPLARLRAGGQLAEFKLEALRFSPAEIKDLLNNKLNFRLSDEELKLLQDKTAGWAAGLRLLAVVLSQTTASTHRSKFIQQLAKTDRYIFDYLAEEVLHDQPYQIQRFLLETSILDELTPSLCQRLTGQTDADQTLEEVFRRNLFLTMVRHEVAGGSEPAYHYHDLFAAFLRQRLEQERAADIPQLHRRAAAAHPRSDKAAQHYLTAESWQEAADVLEGIGRGELERRFLRQHTAEAILALPHETRRQRPWLLLCVGAFYVQRGDQRLSAPLIKRALTLFRQAEDKQGELNALLTELQRTGSINAGQLAEFTAKMAASPQLITPSNQANYHILAQWHYDLDHNWPELTRHFLAGLDLAHRYPQRGGPAWVVALAFGPALLFHDKSMAASEQFAYQLARETGKDDWVARLGTNMILAWIRFYQGQVQEAEESIKKAHHFAAQIGGLGWVDYHIEWLLLVLMFLKQQYGRFEDRIQLVLQRISEQDISAALAPGFMYMQIRACCLQNRLAEANSVLSQLGDPTKSHLFTAVDQVATHLARGMLAQSEKRYPRAESEFLAAVDLHRSVRHTVRLTYPRLSLATLYQQWGRNDEALVEIATALADIRQQGKPGIVLQEGHSIVPLLELALTHGIEREMVWSLLSTFKQSMVTQRMPIPGSNESLTPREVEVLQLIVAGSSNKEIAEQLVVSIWTVKSHMSKILRKLNVSTRTQAAARARELGLHPPLSF